MFVWILLWARQNNWFVYKSIYAQHSVPPQATARLRKPSFLSISWGKRSLNSLIIFMAHQWTQSRKLHLVLRSPELDPAHQICLTGAEQSRQITSSNLQTTLILKHPQDGAGSQYLNTVFIFQVWIFSIGTLPSFQSSGIFKR